VLLRFYLFLGMPSIGLQTVFVQEAASAVTLERQEALAGSVRSLMRATFSLWLAAAVTVALAQSWVLGALEGSERGGALGDL
jgi:hypothetical protein